MRTTPWLLPEVADVRTSVIYEHLRNHAVAPAARP
jgi:hypothetical protein